MEELAVLIAKAIAIAMAVMIDGCCAGPPTAGAAVKVGPIFFTVRGGGAFHSTSRHTLFFFGAFVSRRAVKLYIGSLVIFCLSV